MKFTWLEVLVESATTRQQKQGIPIPLFAKWLQTDVSDFRIIYGLTDTDFNDFEMNDGLTDTDLALLIPQLYIGYRHVIRNYCRNPARIPEVPLTRSVSSTGSL